VRCGALRCGCGATAVRCAAVRCGCGALWVRLRYGCGTAVVWLRLWLWLWLRLWLRLWLWLWLWCCGAVDVSRLWYLWRKQCL